MKIATHSIESENENLFLECEGERLRVKHSAKRIFSRYLGLTALSFAFCFAATWTSLWLFWADFEDTLSYFGLGLGMVMSLIFFVLLYTRFCRSRVRSKVFSLHDKEHITLLVEGFEDHDSTLYASIKPRKGCRKTLFGYFFFDSFLLAVNQAEEIKDFLGKHTQLSINIKERLYRNSDD